MNFWKRILLTRPNNTLTKNLKMEEAADLITIMAIGSAANSLSVNPYFALVIQPLLQLLHVDEDSTADITPIKFINLP